MWHFWNGPLFEFVSDDLVLHPRWLPWLLIGWKIINLWKSYFSSEPLHRMRPNLVQIVLGWSPSKIVSVNPINYPRWPPWLKRHLLVFQHYFKFLTSDLTNILLLHLACFWGIWLLWVMPRQVSVFRSVFTLP